MSPLLHLLPRLLQVVAAVEVERDALAEVAERLGLVLVVVHVR